MPTMAWASKCVCFAASKESKKERPSILASAWWGRGRRSDRVGEERRGPYAIADVVCTYVLTREEGNAMALQRFPPSSSSFPCPTGFSLRMQVHWTACYLSPPYFFTHILVRTHSRWVRTSKDYYIRPRLHLQAAVFLLLLLANSQCFLPPPYKSTESHPLPSPPVRLSPLPFSPSLSSSRLSILFRPPLPSFLLYPEGVGPAFFNERELGGWRSGCAHSVGFRIPSSFFLAPDPFPSD